MKKKYDKTVSNDIYRYKGHHENFGAKNLSKITLPRILVLVSVVTLVVSAWL